MDQAAVATAGPHGRDRPDVAQAPTAISHGLAQAQRPQIASVDRLLLSEALRAVVARHARVPVPDALRARLRALWQHRAVLRLRSSLSPWHRRSGAPWTAGAPSLLPVANLPGTVLHTNLAARCCRRRLFKPWAAPREPCNLVFDLDAAGRGERDAHVQAVRALTAPKPHWSLVGIGGHFRVADIMARAGARLHEVGTTNRIHLANYPDAIDARTALLIKVHSSN